MQKVEFIPARFMPIMEKKIRKVPTGEKKIGFWGKEKEVVENKVEWVRTGWSDSIVDGERLAEDLATTISKLNEEGYQILSVVPITSGAYNYNDQDVSKLNLDNAYLKAGYGYGYSFTSGLMVTATKV